ncbi:MAG: prepilin-type N-terminal cleavage/methylation domain-containing protein [Pseudomonadota bacterium]
MKRKGFTLVELMITVAIIGILGALATSSLMGLIIKSKKAEVNILVSAIFTAEAQYNLEKNYIHPISEEFDPIPVWFEKLNGDKISGSADTIANDKDCQILGFVVNADIYSNFHVSSKMSTNGIDWAIYVSQDLDDDDEIENYKQGMNISALGLIKDGEILNEGY